MVKDERFGTKSTFGDQILSSKTSQPRTKFGTSNRIDKIYEGKEFMERNYGKVSQGCTSKISSGFGNQSSSKNENAKIYSFGKKSENDFSLNKESRPGPGTYHTENSSNQKQILSQNTNEPNTKLGSSSRWSQFNSIFKDNFETPSANFTNDIGKSVSFSFNGKSQRYDIKSGFPGMSPSYLKDPGPGTYQLNSGFGSQVEGKKKSMPNFVLGKEKMNYNMKQYLSNEHERIMMGTFSPGPNIYVPPSSIGNQQSSRKKSSPRMKFGTSDRFSDVKRNIGNSDLPGPGSYVI